MAELFLVEPGPRPPFWEVPQHLWGDGCDFDSDGDSEPDPATPEWTYLWATLRPGLSAFINISPVEEARTLVLRIESDDEDLVRRAAAFLADSTGGRISANFP